MFRTNRAPPFVPSDPNAPNWLLKIEKKKFLGEWRMEQRRRQKLLKQGMPVPPMPTKFQVVQTAENAETTGYPQIGPDTSAFIHKCNYKTFGIGAMEDSDSDNDEGDSGVEDELSENHLGTEFKISQRLRSNVNMLRVKPHMPFDLFNKKIDQYIQDPQKLAALTGSTIKLYVAASRIDDKGVGLYTATPILPFTPVAEFFGHIQRIETKQFQKIESLEAAYGFTNDGVLLFPDLINKQYYAMFPTANRDCVCAAYFANYNKNANLELYRAYSEEKVGSNLGVRKQTRNNRNQERPRFFLFSGSQHIAEHTELCWNYGIYDDLEAQRQDYYHVQPHSLLASQLMVEQYNELYEKNFKKFSKMQSKIIQERRVLDENMTNEYDMSMI